MPESILFSWRSPTVTAKFSWVPDALLNHPWSLHRPDMKGSLNTRIPSHPVQHEDPPAPLTILLGISNRSPLHTISEYGIMMIWHCASLLMKFPYQVVHPLHYKSIPSKIPPNPYRDSVLLTWASSYIMLLDHLPSHWGSPRHRGITKDQWKICMISPYSSQLIPKGYSAVKSNDDQAPCQTHSGATMLMLCYFDYGILPTMCRLDLLVIHNFGIIQRWLNIANPNF